MMHATKKISAAVGLALALTAGVGCEASSDDFVVTRGGKHKDKKCTRTMGYYKTHSIYEQQPNKNIAWPIPETTEGCGMTWYEWLWTQPEGDAFVILAHQFITAQLNWSNAGWVPPEVEQAIYDASALLNLCEIPEEDREEAIALSELLDDYNNGLLGVPHCDSLEND